MRRPTISDLAKEADVSIATVNRILAGTASVKGTTVQRVQAAAERIGFYGAGAIEDRAAQVGAEIPGLAFCCSNPAVSSTSSSARRSSRHAAPGAMRSSIPWSTLSIS